MVFPIQTARKAAHMSRGLGLAQKHFCCDACCAYWWATVCQRCHVGGRTWSALLATCGMDANSLEYHWCNLRGLAYPVLESKDPIYSQLQVLLPSRAATVASASSLAARNGQILPHLPRSLYCAEYIDMGIPNKSKVSWLPYCQSRDAIQV